MLKSLLYIKAHSGYVNEESILAFPNITVHTEKSQLLTKTVKYHL